MLEIVNLNRYTRYIICLSMQQTKWEGLQNCMDLHLHVEASFKINR